MKPKSLGILFQLSIVVKANKRGAAPQSVAISDDQFLIEIFVFDSPSRDVKKDKAKIITP